MSGFEKLDKEKSVYIYLKNGNRSAKTARKLCKTGFIGIYDLKGGILEYQKINN